MGRVKLNNEQNQSLMHFSHPHELELCTQLQDLSPCSGCRLPPLGQMYICKPCSFTLHLSCTKLPQLLTHPSHPNHPLNLLPTSKYPGGRFNCDACNQRGNGFSYHCSNCEFDLHVTCASRSIKITHPMHQCLLELTFKNPYSDAKGFSCDACHKIGSKQWLYRCPTCEFDVHMDCSIAGPAQPTHLQHHHSFPGGTNLVRPNQLFHSASTSAIPQQQPPVMQGGQVRPNQYMQPVGANSAFGNGLMNAAVQGLVEGAAQQVGQTLMQGIIGGGNNNGKEGSSILGSVFGDSSETQY